MLNVKNLIYHRNSKAKQEYFLPQKYFLWLKTLSELILDEVTYMNAGTTGVTAKLADLLVITAIRHYLDNEVEYSQNWLGALEDPRITKAIELVHVTFYPTSTDFINFVPIT